MISTGFFQRLFVDALTWFYKFFCYSERSCTPFYGSMAFCFQCVSNSEVGVVERLGKFAGLASPGLNIICWPIDNVSTTCATSAIYLCVFYSYSRGLNLYHLSRAVQKPYSPGAFPSTRTRNNVPS